MSPITRCLAKLLQQYDNTMLTLRIIGKIVIRSTLSHDKIETNPCADCRSLNEKSRFKSRDSAQKKSAGKMLTV